MAGDVIAGLVLGALPVAVMLFKSAVGLYDTFSSVQNFGSDLEDLASDLGIEKVIFSKWGKECGLAELSKHDLDELAKHDPGWGREEYETLLGALTRMFSYLASAQMLVNRYVNAGTNVSPPNLPDIRLYIPHMLEAGLEGLSSQIQNKLRELQTSAAKINQMSNPKIFFHGLGKAEELKQLIDKIRRLNKSLEKLRPPAKGAAKGSVEFRVPIKHPFQKQRTFFGRAEILKQIKKIFQTTSVR